MSLANIRATKGFVDPTLAAGLVVNGISGFFCSGFNEFGFDTKGYILFVYFKDVFYRCM